MQTRTSRTERLSFESPAAYQAHLWQSAQPELTGLPVMKEAGRCCSPEPKAELAAVWNTPLTELGRWGIELPEVPAVWTAAFPKLSGPDLTASEQLFTDRGSVRRVCPNTYCIWLGRKSFTGRNWLSLHPVFYNLILNHLPAHISLYSESLPKDWFYIIT